LNFHFILFYFFILFFIFVEQKNKIK